jgi:hypothetical protein
MSPYLRITELCFHFASRTRTYKRFGWAMGAPATISMHSHSHSHSQTSEDPAPVRKVYCIVLSAACETFTRLQQHQHRRCRTLSMVSPAGSAPKIIIAVQNNTSTSAARGAAAGAFTLTGCARAALRVLASGTYDDESDSYTDSSEEFTPTHVRTRSNHSDKDVPSISRTASPFEGERAPIPPGWGGRGAGRAQRRERSPGRSQHRREQPQRARIHPTLDTLERGSRLGTGSVVCAACAKPGENFPRCPRCAKMWCSRACRIAAVHRCQPRRSQTM